MPPARSFMFATTIWGNGDELDAVEEVEEVDDAEEELAPLWPPDTVDVTVLVTVFVEPEGGGGGGEVDGAKRLLATEAMPAVTKTAPKVMATIRK